MTSNTNNTDTSPRSEVFNDDEVIYVITRTGKRELLNTQKITERIQALVNRAPKIPHVNPYELTLKICQNLKTGVSTSEIDEYVGVASASFSIGNPYYMQLAGRIVIDNHQKNTARSFIDKMRSAYLRKDKKGNIVPLLNGEFYKYVEEHQDFIEKIIDYNRDFKLDYFGFRSFQRLYGIRINEKIIERPQDVFMRVAVFIHMNTHPADELEAEQQMILDTYNKLSNKLMTHATPTIFNAGLVNSQLSSCYLLGSDDSRAGIMKTADDSSQISKFGGGIGIHVHSWRGEGSLINSTNGKSSGIVPFLRIYDATMAAFNQGGKRMGSEAIYLMPHHPDILKFLALKRHSGVEEERARNLFYALWLPNLFMQRVQAGEMWSLFDPNETVDLSNYYDGTDRDSESYTKRYLQLEAAKLYTHQIPARQLWQEAFETNKQTGMPYLCYSDAANEFSMQKNIGVIKSSNLCAEIYLYSDSLEYAVCNLASINLAACVFDTSTDDKQTPLNHEFPSTPRFDFELLKDITKTLVTNLNIVIDKNFYPTIETERSNMRHRPIGVGVQALADTYCKMRMPFDSPEAKDLNKKIFETIYYAATTRSTELCRDKYRKAVQIIKTTGSYTHQLYTNGNKIEYKNVADLPKNAFAYETMHINGGSPLANGKFHWDLYGKKASELSGMFDWESLRDHCKTFGVRNSVTVALMPTATTSQFLGNNECIEPFTSNLYKRKTLAGEFIIINKYMMNDLYKYQLWNNDLKDKLLLFEGTIQNIVDIPKELRDLYKTAWEIDQSVLIEQAIDRQPFVDQGQSLNWYVEDLTLNKFNKYAFQAWKGKLKTGKYYVHSRPAVMAQKFSINPKREKELMEQLEIEKIRRAKAAEQQPQIKEACDLCSS